MMMQDMTQLGSMMAGLMFVLAIFQNWFPDELGHQIERYFQRLVRYMNPYITIIFHEYQVDDFERSVAYMAIERYLSVHCANGAKRLRANMINNYKSIFLSIDEYEEVTDEFKGIKLWWSSSIKVPQQKALVANSDDEEKRYYKLTFNKKHRDVITNAYLQNVIDEGKTIAAKARQRKLYTNKRGNWSHIIFEHPSTFDTLAMDPKKKKDILDDIMTFSKSKDYYKKVGKSWKRGYLLYGPPGTGKSSMIAAMANFLDYDIFDLELTSVQDNTDLRRLLIHTSSKSIIVIEDIDCSLDLTGQRTEKKDQDNGEEKTNNQIQNQEQDKKKKGSEVTLSGLLNFIDGLWSACGSERLIVFTTNHIEKLDPALIRRGRMDKHIELSYCCYETFKVLAKNYLNLESHELFATISQLLEETKMTPADVAENLMRKTAEESVESCLSRLIKSIENAKEEARLKVIADDVVDSGGSKKKSRWWHRIYKRSNGKKSEQNSEKSQDTTTGSSDADSTDEE
uniref:AAA-ATPase At3g28580-like n=1 Tax=Erigeron canadensis TaxID=72917 RepID=UPI001CB8910F|nr:AAA-ATPase At3g28580-like [Erigeron canadensis]